MPDLEREIFDQASAVEPAPAPQPDEPTPAEPGAEPATPVAGQDRDEHGRFKPKAAAPAADPTPAPAQPQPQPEPQPDHRIPLAEHLREREERQAAQRERDEARKRLDDLTRQLEEMRRPKPQAPQRPDPFADPGAYADHVARETVDPVRQAQDQMRDQFSRLLASEKYGEETVNAAYAALEAEVRANPTARYEAQRIWESQHPYGALVKWHQSQTALKEIGSDPAAYRKKVMDELLKDPEHRKAVMAAIEAEARGNPNPANPAQPRPTNVTRLPPSLNRIASAAPAAPAGGEEAISDRELFSHATARR